MTTGDYNTAVGQAAMYNTTTGSYNTAVGLWALGTNTTGSYHTAVGYEALKLNTTGSYNTAVGRKALTACTTGSINTAIGYDSGLIVTTGANNTLIGYAAGKTTSPGGGITTEDHRIVMGNNDVSDAYIKVAWNVTSDARDKTDITDFTPGLSWVTKLRPVTYRWDERSNYSDDLSIVPDGTHKKSRLNLGLLAQEELEVEKEHGYGNDNDDMLISHLSSDGSQYSMKYERLVPVLVNAIKELSAKVEELEAKLG